MSEQNEALVDRLTQAFNDGNLDVIDELVAPNFVGHNPLSSEDIQGPEGLKGFFAAFRAAMPDIRHPSWTLIAEGDLVAIHMPIKGTLVFTWTVARPQVVTVRLFFAIRELGCPVFLPFVCRNWPAGN